MGKVLSYSWSGEAVKSGDPYSGVTRAAMP
jgi:hypothetical protein